MFRHFEDDEDGDILVVSCRQPCGHFCSATAAITWRSQQNPLLSAHFV